MKRFILFLLSAILLLTFCACGKKPNSESDLTPTQSIDDASKINGESNSGEDKAIRTVYDNSLISELFSMDGSYEDSVGNSYTYSFHVPQLESDAPDAVSINKVLEEKFGGYVNEELITIGNKASLVFFNISWESFWHDSMVCIVVKAENDWNCTEYSTVCFDFATGKAVSNEELLGLVGITTEEFLDCARKAAADTFDSMSSGSKEAVGKDFYDEQRSWTLSDENINTDMMLYLNDAGTLTAILPIASFAGASSYYYVIDLKI